MNAQIADIFDLEAMEQLRRRLRLDPEIIRRFRNSLLKKFESDEMALSRFSDVKDLRIHALELYQRNDSQRDGATKLLFRTDSGHLIETVILRIATGRSTICVSSQVGCAAACDFCATGKMGIAKNLSRSEILDQVLQAGQILATEDRRLQNIVFMGMGEPFHNEAALFEAIKFLTDTALFDRSPRSLLVSTVGIHDVMLRFAERFPAVNLAISLHSADSVKRQRLIPLEKKHPLTKLKLAIQAVNQVRSQEVMIEYLMLAGRNDSLSDAETLIHWLAGLNVRVNLIPFNPIQDAPHLKCSDRSMIDEFARRLRHAGFETTIRYSLGQDIAAACGQLVRNENRKLQPLVRPES